MFYTLFLIQILFKTSLCANFTRLMQPFIDETVIPHVLDEIPPAWLKVIYEGTKIRPGVEIPPNKARDPPLVEFTPSTSSAYHTLIMHDVDSPTRADPRFGQWHHWLVINIPGGDIGKGEERSDYIGPSPTQGSGLHRYVIVLYKQHQKQDFKDVAKLSYKSLELRKNWNLREFAKDHNLGKPVAGTFFKARYDWFVDTLYAKFEKMSNCTKDCS